MFSVLLLATGFINQVGCNTLPIVTYAVDGETASSTFERLKGEMQAVRDENVALKDEVRETKEAAKDEVEALEEDLRLLRLSVGPGHAARDDTDEHRD